jgi:hypothetical protein
MDRSEGMISEASTVLEPVPVKEQPGEGLVHVCRVHDYEEQCEAEPTACVAFCGYYWGSEYIQWEQGHEPRCVVCFTMYQGP